MTSRCYFCDAIATSLDHVPPKVFFPEPKDLPAGTDLRKNLITVPACDEHNSGYSRDDEVAAYTLLLHHRSNHVAVNQFATKTARAFKRMPALDSRVTLDRREVLAPDGSSVLYISRADTAALGRVMDRIARGLYFHDFKRRWTSRLNLVADGMMNPDLSPDPREGDVSVIKKHMAGLPRLGDNPEVFWYQWLEFVSLPEKILHMVFYEGLGYLALPLTFQRPQRIRP